MRLFVTVGTQLPFARLVQAVDYWAASNSAVEVFGQIGPDEHQPRSMQWKPFIDAGEFRRRMEEATVVVAHAGMGSILTALELGKPIIVMPRRADLGEHRNDHQIATARQLLRQRRATVVFSRLELIEKLDRLHEIASVEPIPPHASPRLLAAIRLFVTSGSREHFAASSVNATEPDFAGLSRVD